jgi:fluoroacetyl-CoA thioesterase
MRPVPVGAKGTYSITVGGDDLASKLDPSLARVMSTPTMIGMMEMAAIDAIRSYYDAGETSVGAGIEAQHVAATPPGHKVRAEAEVTKSEGRRLEFKVRAFDEVEEIGSGIHRRAVIDAAKFNERLKAKIKTS